MLDQQNIRGTKFRLFPQPSYVPGYHEPETVWITKPPHEIAPGPSDDKIIVISPLYPKAPYNFPQLPPFRGQLGPVAKAGPDGHFDHLIPGSKEFAAAHIYGAVHLLLDIWQDHLGHEIKWHFADYLPRLEIVTGLDWDNAHAGYGYLEVGRDLHAPPALGNYALNFDVIAHEMGHLILLSQLEIEHAFTPNPAFIAYHEAASDLIALLSILHFDSVLDTLLRRTKGNLLVHNELNQLAEQAGERQIRLASNWRRFSETSNEPHDMSTPFTGAVFDSLVEIYHHLIIDKKLVDLPRQITSEHIRNLAPHQFNAIEEAFSEAHQFNHHGLKACLQQARDIVAESLVNSWRSMPANNVSFPRAGNLMISAMAQNSGGKNAFILEENFQWRQLWPNSLNYAGSPEMMASY